MEKKEQQFVEMPTMTFRKVKTKNAQRIPIFIGGVIISLAILVIIVAVFIL